MRYFAMFIVGFFLANRWHAVDSLIESIIVCFLYCTLVEYFELWLYGQWRFLYVRLPYFVCIWLSWCVYLTFSIESNGPNYGDKPEFCQSASGVSQWEVISEVNQYFAISSRNICVWQVPLFFGRGSDNSVDELPVHFHLSWSYDVRHASDVSKQWFGAYPMSILVCAIYSSGWRLGAAEHSRTAEYK